MRTKPTAALLSHDQQRSWLRLIANGEVQFIGPWVIDQALINSRLIVRRHRPYRYELTDKGRKLLDQLEIEHGIGEETIF